MTPTTSSREMFIERFRQWLCSHEMFLEDLVPRDAAGIVRCPCFKCGKVLEAECGISLPGRWAGFRKHRQDTGRIQGEGAR